MNEPHENVDSWHYDDFPYEIGDLPTLGTVLPKGYWFAVEHTPDDGKVIHLLKNEAVS